MNNDKEQRVGVFKMSEYDLNLKERKRKFNDYDLILCEMCNKQVFDYGGLVYCDHCYHNETNKVEKGRIRYSLCPDCKKPNTGKDWCKECNAKRFQQDFPNWTSGNESIDGFIQEIQLNSQDRTEILEWIPYHRLENIKFLDKGGFSTVYKAHWLDGPIKKWSCDENKWIRYIKMCGKMDEENFSDNEEDFSYDEEDFEEDCGDFDDNEEDCSDGEGDCSDNEEDFKKVVVLKRLDNSSNLGNEFLEEV